MRSAISKRLRGVRYALGDVVFVIGRLLKRAAAALGPLARIPGAIGRGAAGFWRSLSVIARRRLVAALGVAAALLVLLGAVVPNLPCEFPGGDSCPPADDAAELVPAQALAYAHANLDPQSEQYEAAADLAGELPRLGDVLAGQAAAQLRGPGGRPPDFEADVRPWFGGEVAVALLDGVGPLPERVDLLEVGDPDGASAYVETLTVGRPQTTEYEGVEVSVDQRDVASAQVEGFLAIGTEQGVRAVVATATGADGAEPLADDPTAVSVRDELPDHRVAEAWLSESGIDELVAGPGALAAFSPLIAPGASRGVAASIGAADGELELAIRSELDPERERAASGFFAAFPPVDPELPDRLRPQTLAYLGFGDPSATVTALLSQAGAQAPGIASGFDELVRRLRREANVDIERQLLGALGEEAAFALAPAPGQAGAQAAIGLPYLLFVADGVDEEAARRGLAALAGAVTAGELGEQEVSGVGTQSVRVSPAVELTYAVFDGLAAISTDPAGVAGLIDEEGGLAEEPRYEEATSGFPDEVAIQAYLDLAGLVATGEQAGLAEDPVYAPFAGDFRRLDAFALAVSEADDVLATDARLVVGPEPAAEPDASPLAPAGD